MIIVKIKINYFLGVYCLIIRIEGIYCKFICWKIFGFLVKWVFRYNCIFVGNDDIYFSYKFFFKSDNFS